ncbi:flavin reductase family protein [Parafrankia sp. FMc6]|uniref:flavin reductase family protein n=1 Tax=Parafrankia soli TaxID=2599596 RepID=UPI0034D63DB0
MGRRPEATRTSAVDAASVDTASVDVVPVDVDTAPVDTASTAAAWVAADDDAGRFRDAMASFPSGVTIVTTADETGRWWGFTASSFCSVSMSPPLVLVCLAASAQCHPAFERARRFIVHVVPPEHADLAVRFATRGVDKFADAGFRPDESGLPVLDRACVTLDCATHAIQPAGDHSILLGRVERTRVGADRPAVYFRRRFHLLGEAT